MEGFLTILFMVVIGSLIGGCTNHLAIQMLFRPYEAKYIGKWKVPFTPGLIPRRRDELAIQLGKTVEEYLLTPEMIRKKVITKEVENKATDFINSFIKEKFIDNELTIKDYLTKFNLYGKVNELEYKFDSLIELKIKEIKNSFDEKQLRDLLGEKGLKMIAKKVPEISSYILIKGIEYVESPEGDKLIKKMVEEFLSGKGRLGGMVNLFVGDSKMLNDKIKKELISLLKKEQTFSALNNLLIGEVVKFSDKSVKDIVDINVESIVKFVQYKLKEELNLENRLDNKISFYLPNLNEKITSDLVPKIVSSGIVLLDNKIEELLTQLDVKDIVKEQVNTFPVERLEDILLGVSKREFKMITYLGFVLGGMIGIFQGLIAVFL